MNSNETHILIKVSTLGLSEKMSPVLDYFFKHSATNHCLQVDALHSQAIILDIDSIEGKAVFKEIPDKYRDKQLIVLSVRKPEQENIIYVQKPVKAEALLAAIDKVRTLVAKESVKTSHTNHFNKNTPIALKKNSEYKISNSDIAIRKKAPQINKASNLDINLAIIQQSQQELSETISPQDQAEVKKLRLVERTVSSKVDKSNSGRPDKNDRIIGSAVDIDLDNPEQLKNRFYNPDDFFQGFLYKTILESKRQNKPAMLNISEYSIVTLPNANTALIDASESQLQALSSIPLSERTMTIFFLGDAQLKKFSARSKPVKVYSLLWKAAIMASRGRIPSGTDINATVKFRQWSTIVDHVLQFEYAKTIASLWEEQPLSLIETIKKLNIPQRYVFTFYSACYAIGIASMNLNEKVGWLNTKQSLNMAQNKSLMNKFFNKFKHS